MNFIMFEKKAKAFIKEHGLFEYVTKSGSEYDNPQQQWFKLNVYSAYRNKELNFTMNGKNSFFFCVKAETIEEMFDKAFRILKAYGPKATRVKKEKE